MQSTVTASSHALLFYLQVKRSRLGERQSTLLTIRQVENNSGSTPPDTAHYRRATGPGPGTGQTIVAKLRETKPRSEWAVLRGCTQRILGTFGHTASSKWHQ